MKMTPTGLERIEIKRFRAFLARKDNCPAEESGSFKFNRTAVQAKLKRQHAGLRRIGIFRFERLQGAQDFRPPFAADLAGGEFWTNRGRGAAFFRVVIVV